MSPLKRRIIKKRMKEKGNNLSAEKSFTCYWGELHSRHGEAVVDGKKPSA